MIDSALLFWDMLVPPTTATGREDGTGHSADTATGEGDGAAAAGATAAGATAAGAASGPADEAPPTTEHGARRGLSVFVVTLGFVVAPLLGATAAAQARPPAPEAVSGRPAAVAPATARTTATLSAAEIRMQYFYGERMDNLPIT